MAVYVYDFTLPVVYQVALADEDYLDCQVTFTDVIIELNKICKKYTFQKERGEQMGYTHFQGRISLKKKIRKEQMFKWQPWKTHCHFSVTSSASHKDNDYVLKEDTRVGGPWEGPSESTFIPNHVKNLTLRCWQQSILDISQIYEPRKINIVYDNKGNIGKSILSMYMRCHGFARLIPGTVQDAKDICQIVCCMPVSKCYIIDMPRALPKFKLNGLYAAIESLKNGHVYDIRYKYTEKIFNPPNVIVFTNELPDPAMLSEDRWDVWEVVPDEMGDAVLQRYTDFLSDDE